MSWFELISTVVARIPIERILFPPRDDTEALEKLVATMTEPGVEKKVSPEQKAPPTITQEPERDSKESVATACVPCALGHFSASAGLLNELVRFKDEGITSNQILDRVAQVLQEQNTLERKDLTPENMQRLPSWEREIAEEALRESRRLRHSLESFSSIGQLEKAAADTSAYYRELNRKWFKQRFTHLGPEKAERIAEEVGKLSAEDKVRVLKGSEEIIEGAKK
ncbi:hypothetical protein LCGC14_1798470 [marine sediment metagenome]|uniref:Uncharacterized protein n=1 Tax=marine sediment metagenome TaxID=412755 RepID=A0A0F9GQ95_9ZZZZ